MKIIYVFFLFLLFSCNKDSVNIPFEPIAMKNEYDSIKPKKNYDYFEIRSCYYFDTIHYSIEYSSGNKIDDDTLIQTPSGAKVYFVDDMMRFNILARVNGKYEIFDTYNEILSFLGTVDTKGEALFIAVLNGYGFLYNNTKYGIRREDSDYQIYAFKTVKMCTPVQIDKYLIEINSSGKLILLYRSVYEIHEHACI